MSTISNQNSLDDYSDRKLHIPVEPIFTMVYPSTNQQQAVKRNAGGSVSSKSSSEYYDGASAPPRLIPIDSKKDKKTKASLKALEASITRLVVIVVLAVIVILACMIPVLYYLGDTAKLFKKQQNEMSQTRVITEDPFKLKELENLLDEITRHAKMTQRENEKLKLMVNNSKLFGYCTKNVPSSACLPCLCTPYNKLNNEYACDCTNLKPKKDCKDFHKDGFRVDGIYTLQPDGKNNMSVFCDQTSDTGGWEVIQRRQDGSTGFHRNWNEYKLGFGNLHRDFYLGNEKIHMLTKSRKQIFITMEGFDGKRYSAFYDNFQVMDEPKKYELNCSKLIWGNAPDAFCHHHSGMLFSTYDIDNDKKSEINCAAGNAGGGGWWYSTCYGVNLNGVYYHSRRTDEDGIRWSGVDAGSTMKKVEMKMRSP